MFSEYSYSIPSNYYTLDNESSSINKSKIKYPRYYKVLTKLQSFISDNSIVAQAFMDNTDKWNVGGKTSAYSPFNITINKLRVMTLEKLTVKTAINAYSFALGITTLHELVHYARFKKGLDNYEYGNAFEKQATGIFWPYDENLFKTNMYDWKY